MENSKDISSVWRALITFTRGANSRQKEIPHHFTADALKDYFLSIAGTLVKSHYLPESNKHYSCSKRRVDFLMAVHEMGKYTSELNNKKSFAHEEIMQSVA